MRKFSEIIHRNFPLTLILSVIILTQTTAAQSGRKQKTAEPKPEPPVTQTEKTEPEKNEPPVKITSLKIVGKLEHDAGYFHSNDFKDAMKELERELSLRYKFSLKVERGEKMDFDEAQEFAKNETDAYVLWIGFVAGSCSHAVMCFDFANYAILKPKTAEFVTRGQVAPRSYETVRVLGLPPTQRKPSLESGMKDSIYQISKILQKGGWFD